MQYNEITYFLLLPDFAHYPGMDEGEVGGGTTTTRCHHADRIQSSPL